MVTKGQRTHDNGDVKARAVIEAIKGVRTVNEMASAYGVHPVQITKWKKQALEELPRVFSRRREESAQAEEALTARLYQEIGQLKVELDWLKKKLGDAGEEKRRLIESGHRAIPVTRQCELVGLARSSWYDEPAPARDDDLQVKRWIDEQYTRTPFYGIRRMTHWLRCEKRQIVNHKRVGRLMREMGLEAIYPKPRVSRPGEGRLVYAYLLRGLPIVRPNQVWGADITYIRLAQGFVYLVAILDWFSRAVLSRAVSVTMDAAFCMEALTTALQQGRPEIFNTDQGSQFTSADFTGRLAAAEIRISMDGRGRVFDNIFVERLWRTVKYEEVYLQEYAGVPMAVESLGRYFRFYNTERFHQSLGYKTPEAVHRGL